MHKSLRAFKYLTLLVLALAAAGAGCDRSGGNGAAAGSRKPRVVATTTMIGDLARRIGGEHIELQVIMPAGVDPHTFKPSTGDLGAISRADLVFYNGLHLEGKMVELFEDQIKDRAVAISRDIDHTKLLAWAQGQGGAHDPHIWFDASLWTSSARTVGDALAKLDPAHAADYAQRAQATVAQLNALHDELKSKLASVPKGKRVLITSHDAYNYFGRAYDVEVRGLQGISTETEAGLSNINSAVDFIISRKIPAIFVESSVSHKTIERVQADCKSRGFNVAIGGELYSDAMGVTGEHPGYAVETYEGMFRYNVDTIVKALNAK
ncbi:MAG: zinc ABC transporter substrate-binding protein [Anaerolineae bacterium]|nr:zinc ABC transporter substrate-binding protein [Phycisphaerae bacterium]